ncbi:hypothetical protein [Cryptosporangium sp. NPDC051539]|uniref:hypothetical protein n=1 Tax=Cryptosporangium sp. NPDC051539 TaxID=3363962 RepID=UPI0037961139
MFIDARWIVLVVAVAGVMWLVSKQEKWATPLTVGIALGAALYAILDLGQSL